jgi:dUTP pyrophosphatase
MLNLTVKIARVRENAILPTRSHDTDAGMDLYASLDQQRCIRDFMQPNKIPTGIAVEIPDGYVGLVVGRSGKYLEGLMTSVGVIDPGYRGEVHVIYHPHGSMELQNGERVGQLLVVPCPPVIWKEVTESELSQTSRSKKGLGSTGK